MDIIQRNKFLLIWVIILALFNFILVYFILSNNKASIESFPPKNEFKKLASTLKEKLSLSAEQESQLLQLREMFFYKESELSKLIKSQRDSMNKEMFQQHTDSVLLNNLARRVAENEYLMECLRIRQSVELKNICTEEQLMKLEWLVKDIKNYFKPEKRK